MLSPSEIGVIEYECREVMLALGYPPDGEIDTRSATRRLIDASRSDLTELTTGSARRLLRIARATTRRR
ncbi:MAG: hypothetical protein R2695_07480 [Acidimicrobiales bacterium]